MRIVALGTSEVLVSCVKGLIQSGHEVICLVSEPEMMLPASYGYSPCRITKDGEF